MFSRFGRLTESDLCLVIHHPPRSGVTVIEQQTVISSSCFHKIRHRLSASEVFNLPDLWKKRSVTLNKE